jgi:hypothetical protein
MKLKFIKQHIGYYNKVYKVGDTIKYYPWPFRWQDMDEPERVLKGIFVHCYRMGEFDCFTKDSVVVK